MNGGWISPGLFLAIVIGAVCGVAVAFVMDNQRRSAGALWGLVVAVVVALLVAWLGGVL